MTVCIAARAYNVIVAATDRMMTSADIQFEPSAGTKIIGLTNSIFLLTAGDAALQAEIYPLVQGEILQMIKDEPQKWMAVSEAAELYVKYYSEIRNKRAANQILAPLHLTLDTFLANQKTMSNQIVTDLTKELLNF